KKFNALYDHAIDEVELEARKYDLGLYRDAGSIGFTPMFDGQAMDEAQFAALDEEVRFTFTQNIDAMEDLLNHQLSPLPAWRRDTAEKQRLLEKETANKVIEPLVGKLKKSFSDSGPKLAEYYGEFQRHLSRHVQDFLSDEKSGEALPEPTRRILLEAFYGINVLVDNGKSKGSPVIYEPHPTYENIFGRIESSAETTGINTGYQKILAGALHQANGGYLLIDAEKLLELPHVYAALKRALKGREVRTEHLAVEHGHVSSMGQTPSPIELSLKVVLVGARNTYYLLQSADPDFEKMFRVLVDFEEEVTRSSEAVRNYSRLIKTICEQEELAPITRPGVARLVEFSSREAGDQYLLSSHIGNLVDLLCEADYQRAAAECELITEVHVSSALQAQQERASRLQETMLKGIINRQTLIDTDGVRAGSCNGLTVLQVGDFPFGMPARITSTVFPGKQGIIDIERESDLGRSIHSKGVLILSGYLGHRYAQAFPLTLSANIAIEQSYGEIDGDSASLAELCALISALTSVPLSQRFAITGSINQYGEVQTIGGVNEKIEGFFELCSERGGDVINAVIVPEANQRNLMLNPKIIAAVDAGEFNVFTVSSVDECLSILMDIDLSQPLKIGDKKYASFDQLVSERLKVISSLSR
ncbi:MAG: Lon protease family protein, partial [Pseudomonadales bacterium]